MVICTHINIMQKKWLATAAGSTYTQKSSQQDREKCSTLKAVTYSTRVRFFFVRLFVCFVMICFVMVARRTKFILARIFHMPLPHPQPPTNCSSPPFGNTIISITMEYFLNNLLRINKNINKHLKPI